MAAMVERSGMHGLRVHVERDVPGGIAAVAGLAAAMGRQEELPDPLTLVRTGCGGWHELVMTSRVPEDVTCRACREHAWAACATQASALEAAGQAERGRSTARAQASWDLA